MKTSQKILEYLDVHGATTIAELAAALERTKADIREQMGKLIALNFVKVVPAQGSDKPGRPAARFEKPFSLPEPVAKNLLTSLIHFAGKNSRKNGDHEALAVEILRAILSNYSPTGTSCASRLNQAVEYLGSLGLKTSWIATRNGPKFTILRDRLSPLLEPLHSSRRFPQDLLTLIKEKAVG